MMHGFTILLVVCDVRRVQGSGVGGLSHNSLLIGWPHKWKIQPKFCRAFIGQCFHYNNFMAERTSIVVT